LECASRVKRCASWEFINQKSEDARMFQTFEVTSSPETGPARLAALRAELVAQKVDGFIVPRADRFQGEYVAPCDVGRFH
jgi:hypothetical protein